MVLEIFTYYNEGRKTKMPVRVCRTILSKTRGLMFKKKSPSLLFLFNKEKTITIHSFFCKPFRSIWLDKNKNVTKIIDVKRWKASISGRGKYLLEIPKSQTTHE
ncbi:MAG: DUF192 domain-containing protein [archaeon]